MPWLGNGTFSRIYSWVSDAAAGIDITASRTDTDTDNITVAGFNNVLTRDGQGSASQNLPMNTFRHTGCGNGVAATDYATVGQMQSPGTPALTALIPAAAYLGEMKDTALIAAQVVTLMPGWYLCSGQTRPRTDPLWQATGNVSAGNWLFGNGDGTTTYTLPNETPLVNANKVIFCGA